MRAVLQLRSKENMMAISENFVRETGVETQPCMERLARESGIETQPRWERLTHFNEDDVSAGL
jgi:hypothetical protein